VNIVNKYFVFMRSLCWFF